MIKTDSDIQQDVEAELRWDPQIDDTDVSVKTANAIVTLTGFVNSYAEKYHAATAAKRVSGVTALANDIEVRLAPGVEVPDPELAREAVAALKINLPFSWNQIKLTLQDGRVSLEGTVEWHYQRERAERVVQGLRGVVSVRNSIRIKPVAVASGLRDKISAAFHRNAQLHANSIHIEEHNGNVTLRGTVRSWAEWEQASDSAWAAPGVTHVNNELSVVS